MFSDSRGGASAAPGNSVSRLSVTFKRYTQEEEDRRRNQAHPMNNINISVVIRSRGVESCDQTRPRIFFSSLPAAFSSDCLHKNLERGRTAACCENLAICHLAAVKKKKKRGLPVVSHFLSATTWEVQHSEFMSPSLCYLF